MDDKDAASDELAGAAAEPSFRMSVRHGVAQLTLCRVAKRNSLPRSFWRDLPRTVRELEHLPEVRVLLIDGEGSDFSSGIDLALLDSLDSMGRGIEVSRKAEQLRRIVLSLQESLSCLESSPLPVICAIQGQCIGGALDLVCAADIRLASCDTQFIPMETNLGFVPDLGTVQRLAGAVSPAVANDWLMSGRALGGEEALRVGFVSRCCESAEALKSEAATLSLEIASKSPVAMRGLKDTFRFTREHGVPAGLRYVAAWQSGVFPGEDLSESLRARKKGQAPRYSGLASSARLPGGDEAF